MKRWSSIFFAFGNDGAETFFGPEKISFARGVLRPIPLGGIHNHQSRFSDPSSPVCPELLMIIVIIITIVTEDHSDLYMSTYFRASVHDFFHYLLCIHRNLVNGTWMG